MPSSTEGLHHWLDDDVLSYCERDSHQRLRFWDSGDATPPSSRPWCVIPLFELFRVVFHIAPEGPDRLDEFRRCWLEAANINGQRCTGGFIVRIVEHVWSETDNPLRDMWPVMARPPTPHDPTNPRDRDDERDRRIFREFFRRLTTGRYETITAEQDSLRCWSEPIPDDIWAESAATHSSSVTGDLVLDTNIFVELLNELPLLGLGSSKFCASGRSSDTLQCPRIRKRFDAILATRGSSGKLIVPLPVLIETFGVIRERPDRDHYRSARELVKALSLQGDEWSLWQAFSFEDLSFKLLEAYLTLFEGLLADSCPSPKWPSFTDSLILAYGLSNACPVISAEWHEKDDWRPIEDCFGFLRTGLLDPA